jgi:hypothetical protein
MDQQIHCNPGALFLEQSFNQTNSTHWQINSADGSVHEVIGFSNGASIDPSDYSFA